MRYREGEPVLREVDLTLAAGSFHFLVGPSGAGKTSLFRLISLSHPATHGIITLFGRDVSALVRHQESGLRGRIGVVFQDFRLLDHLTAFDNIALPLRTLDSEAPSNAQRQGDVVEGRQVRVLEHHPDPPPQARFLVPVQGRDVAAKERYDPVRCAVDGLMVLPAPLGPTRKWKLPAASVRSTSRQDGLACARSACPRATAAGWLHAPGPSLAPRLWIGDHNLHV